MWTATLKAVSKSGGFATCIVEYSDGLDKFTRAKGINTGKGLNPNWLAIEIGLDIEAFESAYAYADTLVLGAVVPITEQPSQDDLDKAAYLAKVQSLQMVKVSAEAEALDPSDAKIAAFKASTKLEAKPEFFNIK